MNRKKKNNYLKYILYIEKKNCKKFLIFILNEKVYNYGNDYKRK